MKRLLRLTSYTAYGRYRATLHADPIGWIPRQADIRSPYAYSPTHAVWFDPARGWIIIVETAHKRYDVFLVENQTVYQTDELAENADRRQRQHVG